MKIKIAIFTKDSDGGTGILLKNLTLLNKKGFLTHIFLYKKPVFTPLSINAHVLNDSYPENNKFSYIKTCLLLLNIYKTIYVVSKNKFDLILTCGLYSSIILLLLKLFLIRKTKIVCLINNNYKMKIMSNKNILFGRFILFLFSRLMKFSEKIICVSSGLAKDICNSYNYPKSNCTVIHNTTNTLLKYKKNNKSIKENKNITLISVGRLSPQKDFKTIIRSFSTIAKNHNNMELLIIGDGEQKNELIQLSHQMGLNEKIHFLGWKNNLSHYLKKSNIFLFSSHYEGFGRVIVEAMKHGLPIIATDSPYGPSEILDNGKYGILVPVGDCQKMTNAIKNLIGNSYLMKKYSNLAYLRSKKFTLNNFLGQYDTFIRSLVFPKRLS